MSVQHIYRAVEQPATRFMVYLDDKRRHRFQYRRRQLCRTDCCRRLRQRGNCVVQVYYDAIYHWCRNGYGCKARP